MFTHCFIRITADPGLIPGTLVLHQEYILNRTPVHQITIHTPLHKHLPQGQYIIANPPISMFECLKNPEIQE